VQLANLDSDKSICVKFRYDSTLTEEKDYFIQIAMIFTNSASERIVRVLNSKVYTTHNFYNIFQNADIDAIVNSKMKIAASGIFHLSLNQIRADVQSDLIKLMKCAREVGTDKNYSRVLLPDSLKLLPLYMNSMLKLPGFTVGVASLESRAFSLSAVLSMTVLQSRLLLYPKVYQVDLENFSVNPKQLLPCSLHTLKENSVYLINNGDVVLVFVGESVSQDCFLRFFQRNEEENTGFDREEFKNFTQIVDYVTQLNPSWHYSLYFHFQGTSSDYMIRRLMVEDNLGPEVSYPDYLRRLQKNLINLMAGE
jgi:protein transport protein SEC24